jgi:hypothetical protein
MKKNCWQFKKCGREMGGANVHEFGVCPSATAKKYHGVHGGTHGGRACWVVAGTYCKGKTQGTFAHKHAECFRCDFYEYVKKHEKGKFVLTAVLLKK